MTQEFFRTYKRIECATIFRGHRYALSSALAIAGPWSRLPARAVSVLLTETVKALGKSLVEIYCSRCAEEFLTCPYNYRDTHFRKGRNSGR